MYVEPLYAAGTPLIPNTQSSLRPRCTTFAFHALIAVIDALSVGPSKIPQPSMHAYSVPDRFTPCSWIALPDASSRRLPETWRPAPVGPGKGAGSGNGAGSGDGTGSGDGAGSGEDDGATQPVVVSTTSAHAETPDAFRDRTPSV